MKHRVNGQRGQPGFFRLASLKPASYKGLADVANVANLLTCAGARDTCTHVIRLSRMYSRLATLARLDNSKGINGLCVANLEG